MLFSVNPLTQSLNGYAKAATDLHRSAAALGDLPRPVEQPDDASPSGLNFSDQPAARPEPPEDLPVAIARLDDAENQVSATIALVRANDKMIGTLLDTVA